MGKSQKGVTLELLPPSLSLDGIPNQVVYIRRGRPETFRVRLSGILQSRFRLDRYAAANLCGQQL